MLPRDHDQLRTALRALSRASDSAEISAHVASVARSRGVDGCVVALFGGRSVALVAHAEPAKIAAARQVLGAASLADLELTRAAMSRREALHVRRDSDESAFERVRVVWGTGEIAIVPMLTDTREVGVVALFGHRIPLEHVRAMELLALAAADAIERTETRDELRAAIRARDAALSVLGAVNENSALPQVFFDASLRVIAHNDAFVALSGRPADELHGAAYGTFAFEASPRLRQAIVRVIERKEPERLELVERDRALIAIVHPVPELTAAGVTLVDITALHAVVVQSRTIADAAILLGVVGDPATAIDVLTTTCTRAIADAALTMRATGEIDARAGEEQLGLSRVAQSLLAQVATRGPARVARTGIADALTADDLALLGVPNVPLHLVAVPLQLRGDSRVLLLGRRRERGPFVAHEVALATEVAKIASRALDGYAAVSEATAWGEIFADFVATLSRELRDSLTALLMRLFMAEHTAVEDRATQTAAVRLIAERMRDNLQRLDRALPAPPRAAADAISLGELTGELVRDAVARIAPAARLYEQISSALLVRGDKNRLREAIRGVAEHVVATAPPDALICARVEEVGSEIVIALSRTGEGFGADEARHVFDALWEGRHTARALTIARAVFEAHGGRAWVETTEDTGVAYCFSLAAEARVTVA